MPRSPPAAVRAPAAWAVELTGARQVHLPHSESVYLHGTPAQQLFSRTRRDFSHGCIRVEDPARFSQWVLRQDPTWPRERIDAAMQGDRTMQVNLKEKLGVVVFYDTVHVNSEQTVFFVDDIYGHDKALDSALQRGYPFAQSLGARAPSKTRR